MTALVTKSIEVPCLSCGAQPGEKCRTTFHNGSHAGRIADAAAQTRAANQAAKEGK